MIVKSYEIKKFNIEKYNLFLLYGENLGLKKDIKKFFQNRIKEKDDNIETLSLYENEVLANEENFYNLLYSGSLFANKKIIGCICHGAQLLISAINLNNRKITGYYSIKDDIVNSGASYIDAPFVEDYNIIT